MICEIYYLAALFGEVAYMQYNKTYLDNLRTLKICKKVQNFISVIYYIICGVSMFIGLYIGFLIPPNQNKWDTLLFFTDQFAFKLVTLLLIVGGMYKKKIAWEVCGGIVVFVDAIIFGGEDLYGSFIMTSACTGATTVLIVPVIYTTYKLIWLESQDGYPNFSERVDYQDEITEKVKKSDTYFDRRYKELSESSTPDMETVDTSSDDLHSPRKMQEISAESSESSRNPDSSAPNDAGEINKQNGGDDDKADSQTVSADGNMHDVSTEDVDVSQLPPKVREKNDYMDTV